MSKKVKAKAPKTLGAAIKMALNDLKLVEKDRQLEITMDNAWLTHNYNTSKCAVCFAGSVMAKTCNLQEKLISSDDTEIEPADFTKIWANTFYALDSIRKYNIIEALYEFYGENDAGEAKLRKLLQFFPMNIQIPNSGSYNDDTETNSLELDLDVRRFFGNVHTYASNSKKFKQNMQKLSRVLISKGI